ncbi:hypothetical protein GCM10011340_08200 [Roseivirga thermotolerans]|uniref:Uncharacterized protein n=2 Tax=Roseivirga thermotolerans TaxID=1758176 RepID=A0ABQ3I1K7_9BACT|nr:hypothetical protein GCM10011340_08200 [Roseivirga thermotolerans]
MKLNEKRFREFKDMSDKNKNILASSTAPTETIFYENKLPALSVGNYTIEVEHTVSGTKINEPNPFKAHKYFAVQGRRFSITDLIDHVYPPVNTDGDYKNTLPHVVFNNPSYAWQRSLYAASDSPVGAQTYNPNPTPSWLAVLLFDQADPMPTITSGTAADLMSPNVPATTYCYGDFALGYGEKSSQPIQYIDVPLDLFTSIAPSADDMIWLSHAREVAVEGTINHSNDADPTKKYCTVMGNRLPTPGNKSLAVLVSLEGMKDVLPDSEGNPGTGLGSNTTIRLLVLKSWTYNCINATEDFKSLVTKLGAGAGPLQVPTEKVASSYVVDALDLGYTAFNHNTRKGASTVSWYHGPFVPNKSDDFSSSNEVHAHSDSLLRYDPDTGMFDVSYAAAWQIGQLMALHDRQFAMSLYDWKKSFHQALIQAINEKLAGNDDVFQVIADFNENPAKFLSEKVFHPGLTQEVKKFIQSI